MSSPVYELLKRPDELFVVEHAHLQPRFVEDSVRFALKETLDRYPDLDDSDFLFSRQVNLETIHRHDVLAERIEHGRRAARRARRAHRRRSTPSCATGSALLNVAEDRAGATVEVRRRAARRDASLRAVAAPATRTSTPSPAARAA